MNPNLSDPNPKDHNELMDFLRAQSDDQRHVPMWVHPELARHLTRQIGHPHVVSHPMTAQVSPPPTGGSPFDLVSPRTGTSDRTGGPISVQQPAFRGDVPTVQTPTVSPEPSPSPIAGQVPRAGAVEGSVVGSHFNSPGGFTPMGPGYTGTPSVAPTTWTRDSSAPGGWVPAALPLGPVSNQPGMFGVTRNQPVGFGTYPSIGIMTQKFR